MSDLDDFLAEMLLRQLAAVEALHNGDPAPQLAMSSTQDPVTLFGAAGMGNSGWDEVSRTFHWLASRFSDCTAQSFDLVAAGISGDLAYTVGFDYTHTPATASRTSRTHCGSPTSTAASKASGRFVHRHADRPPIDQSR